MFHDGLEGLLLAEIELPTPDAQAPTPPPIVAEVTGDDRYSGGRLAGLRNHATDGAEFPSRS